MRPPAALRSTLFAVQLRGQTCGTIEIRGKTGRNAVIRQAISCDICATEKRQTNHWFVAYEQGGELRVSGWNSRYKLRQGAKHLCGQTCLHKLVDEFMAKSIASRTRRPIDEPEMESAPNTDASLASGA